MMGPTKFALAIAGLIVLSAGGPSRAGQPPCATSDGTDSTACGSLSLQSNTGTGNTAIGNYALYANTSGGYNTASGAGALQNNTTANDNTASGSFALYDNTTGYNNVADGFDALYSNTTGGSNSAVGFEALYANTTGYGNTADGEDALADNTSGYQNSAIGSNALENNTTGINNTAGGVAALQANITGNSNTATGAYALFFSITSSNNTASGYDALYNTTGMGNTAFGADAGKGNTTGAHNTFIGTSATSTAGNFTNGTALGYDATLRASNEIVLGNSSITKIYAKVTSITAISDRRLKKDISPLGSDLGLGFIEKLKPVAYRFNNGDETQRYGFIAQEVEAALPSPLHGTVETSQPEHGLAMVERGNDKDRTYRMSYGELTAPMVKAIQEQQQEIAAERARNAALRHALAAQAATFDAEIADLRRSMEAIRRQVGAVTLSKN